MIPYIKNEKLLYFSSIACKTPLENSLITQGHKSAMNPSNKSQQIPDQQKLNERKKKPFLRHPLFWSLFIITSLCAGIVSYFYFSTAIPLVDLKISMNRAEAFSKASTLAEKYHLGPQQYKEAAYFNTDSDTQNYIELERGGAQAWRSFLGNQYYHPYTWLVRHFKEGDTNEVYFKFTPEGKPYGFTETIAESAPGAALTSEEARTRAEQFLTHEWNTKIQSYKLKDSRKEVRATGRIDHTFIFEKELENLGDAHYLLTMVVTGDKITTIDHTIDIPEAFTRSFKNIRALNDIIYHYASIVIYLIYLVLGCLGGILFLLKKNWLLPKPAIYAGVGLALFQLLAGLNQFPFLWFAYDTAQSTQTFLFQNFLNLMVEFIAWSVLYTTTFIAAEGLTRRAFGGHMQLWSAWKIPAASSYTMLGKTITSYCIVALDMAFVVLLYGIGMRYFGWWSPSSALTDPNILGTYIPALGVLSKSLSAGFWEEAIFRAVPLATAALIGRKIGYPKTLVILALLIQPIIFGAAHASYPSLPSYVRILELYLPFFGFGVLYLLFGLIPVIVAHVIFDAVLFSLPLFVSDAPGMMLQRALVIIGCALPLLIVLISRLRTGRWLDMPAAFYNGAWQPVAATLPFEKPESNIIKGAREPFSKRDIASFMGLGALSLIAWGCWSSFNSMMPSLTITEVDAIQVASKTLQEKNITLDPSWQYMPSIFSPGENLDEAAQHLFAWQHHDKDSYKKILGTYLATPAWVVRIARFTGDLKERAEEFQIRVNNSGIVRTTHILPQTAPGKKIDEQTARALALAFIAKTYHLSDLHEVAAQSDALPNRIDWYFTFSQPAVLSENQESKNLARIAVVIAGDTVTDATRAIHIPEDWSRTQKKRKALTDCIATLRWFAWFMVIMLGALQGAILWRRGQLKIKRMLIGVGLYAACSLLIMVLNFPQTIATFSTAKPLVLQISSYFLLEGAKIIFESLIIGILAGVILSTKVISAISKYQKIIAGVAAGLFWSASMILIQAYVYPSYPWFPNLAGAGSYAPWLVFLWRFLVPFIKQTVYAEVLAYFASGSRNKAILALIISILLFTPYDAAANLGQWLVAALIVGSMISTLYLFIVRAQPKTVPILTAVPFVLVLIKEGIAHALPGSPLTCGITALAIVLAAFLLSGFGDTKAESH